MLAAELKVFSIVEKVPELYAAVTVHALILTLGN